MFSGSDGVNNYALDAQIGKPLWNLQTGGATAAKPVSFTIEGRQYVTIAADRVSYVFSL